MNIMEKIQELFLGVLKKTYWKISMIAILSASLVIASYHYFVLVPLLEANKKSADTTELTKRIEKVETDMGHVKEDASYSKGQITMLIDVVDKLYQEVKELWRRKR